jgi:hypothetical protein
MSCTYTLSFSPVGHLSFIAIEPLVRLYKLILSKCLFEDTEYMTDDI